MSQQCMVQQPHSKEHQVILVVPSLHLLKSPEEQLQADPDVSQPALKHAP